MGQLCAYSAIACTKDGENRSGKIKNTSKGEKDKGGKLEATLK
jgi:hypothetical protein